MRPSSPPQSVSSSSPGTVDWRDRFIGAYDEEFREWIDDVAAGREASGPSSWDGYAAAVVADACITALHTGDGWAEVVLRDQPDFYRR